MLIYKNLLIFLVLVMAIFFGYVIGFAYISDNPAEAFHPDTWRSFLVQLRSF